MQLLKKGKWLVAAWMAIALSASLAEATPFVIVTTLGTNPTDGVRTANGFTAYLIQVVTDNGKNITAIDVGGPTAANPDDGLFGNLLQRWTFPSADDPPGTPETPSPINTARFTSPPVSGNLDSHFLFSSADLNRFAITSQPTEDNTGINPIGGPNDTAASDFGFGTQLTTTFGISIGQSSSVDLAYVVLPTGQLGAYSMDVATEDLSSKTHLVGVIPEPSSALLLAGVFGPLMRVGDDNSLAGSKRSLKAD